MKQKVYGLNIFLGVLIVFQIVLIRLSMLYLSDFGDIFYEWCESKYLGIYQFLKILSSVVFYSSFVLIMASWGCYVHLIQFSEKKTPPARTKLLLFLCISQMLVSLWYLFSILFASFGKM